MSVFVRLRILATGVALLVMSVFWFRPIHAGLMKAVPAALLSDTAELLQAVHNVQPSSDVLSHVVAFPQHGH